MKFTKDFLKDRLGDQETTVESKIVDTTRWSIVSCDIFKHEGKLYETSYSRGATEQQDESPYEYDEDEIECPEVVAVQKTITVYEHVADAKAA